MSVASFDAQVVLLAVNWGNLWHPAEFPCNSQLFYSFFLTTDNGTALQHHRAE